MITLWPVSQIVWLHELMHYLKSIHVDLSSLWNILYDLWLCDYEALLLYI